MKVLRTKKPILHLVIVDFEIYIYIYREREREKERERERERGVTLLRITQGKNGPRWGPKGA